jgi:hypothetical protein
LEHPPSSPDSGTHGKPRWMNPERFNLYFYSDLMIYGKQTDENEPAGYIMFDVIMPVTRHHNNIACLSIMSLMRNVKPRRIYVVTARNNFSFFEKLQNQDPVMVLDENSLIPGVNLPSIIKFIENAGQNHSRAGWYFQQFLKMYACFLPDITDHYMLSARTSITIFCATTLLTLNCVIAVCNRIPLPVFCPGRVLVSAL